MASVGVISGMDQNKMNYILQHLLNSSKGNSEIQRQLYNENEALKSDPEFISYLTLIVTNASIDANIRFMACLRIKALLRLPEVTSKITTETYANLRDQLITLLDDQVSGVRTTAGTLLAHLANKEHLKGWTNAIQNIISRIDPGNQNTTSRSAAMLALFRIWEDIAETISLDTSEDEEFLSYYLSNKEASSIAEYTLKASISLINDQVKDIRYNAIRTANTIFDSIPTDNYKSIMPTYIENMFNVGTTDQSNTMRVLLCQAFSTISVGYFSAFNPYVDGVLQFISFCLNPEQSEDLVREKAADFICLFIRQPEHSDEDDEKEHKTKALAIEKYIPQLVPALFASVCYSQEEVIEWEIQYNSEDVSVSKSIANSRSGSSANNDDDGEKDSSQSLEWNHRKAAASALEQLARTFRGPLFSFITPTLTSALSNEDWKVREAAVLILGAISFGCVNTGEMRVALPQLVSFLIQSLSENNHPILWSTAIWSVGCFSSFLLSDGNEQQFFVPALQSICNSMVAPNRFVAEAACSALATLVEAADEKITPYLQPVVAALVAATKSLVPRSYACYFDAVSTVLESTKDFIGLVCQPLVPVLVQFYKQRECEDIIIPDVMYSIMALVRALAGTSICLEIVGDVFYTTLRFIDYGLQNLRSCRENDEPEDNHIVALISHGVDTISAIFEVLGNSTEALVTEGQLLPRILTILDEKNPTILQATHALVGDIVRTCSAVTLRDFIEGYIFKANSHIVRDSRYENAAINAIWAIGEYINAFKQSATWVIPLVINNIVSLFLMDSSTLYLNINISLTLALMSIHGTEQIVSKMPSEYISGVAERWVYWSSFSSTESEMKKCYTGYGLFALAAPSAVYPSSIIRLLELYPKLDADDSVYETIANFIRTYREHIGPESWNKVFNSLSPEAARIAKTM